MSTLYRSVREHLHDDDDHVPDTPAHTPFYAKLQDIYIFIQSILQMLQNGSSDPNDQNA